MTREFSADSLVMLPKLNVDSGLALWQALRAGFMAEKKLPKFLQPAWQNVEDAGAELSRLAQQRLADNGGKAPPAEKRKADGQVDNAVGALAQFLDAWARLPDTLPETQLAAAVRQALFPDGTGFLKLPFEQEWAQIDRRVALLKSEGLDKQIAKLGGTAFVVHLEEAHRAYGKALGLTAVPAASSGPVVLGDPLAMFSSALRTLVQLYRAMNETMRRFSTGGIWRKAMQDLELGDHRVPVGSLVGASMGLVNLDPGRYPDPHAYRPDRYETMSTDAYQSPPVGSTPLQFG